MKNGYGIALNEWLFNDRIKNELRLLIYISSLTAKNGYCFASNEHFAEKFKIRTETISRQIKKLIDLNYVSAEYERAGATVKKRILTIDININRHCVKSQPPIDQKVKDNNTSINNTSNNKRGSRFQKPTIEDIFNYLTEEKNKEKSFAKKESEKIWHYYESKNWKVGRVKMANWRSAVSGWLSRIDDFQPKTKQTKELTQFQKEMKYNG